MAVYNVTAPDGTQLRLEGPANATPEQIDAAAQAAYADYKSKAPKAAPAAAPPTKFEQARESYTKYSGGPAAPVGIEPTYATPRAGTPTGLPEGAGQVVEPETTLAGIGGAISRGIAPAAVLAGAGALAAPLVGVAAPVGAALGGGALLASKVLGVDQPFVEKLNELMTRAGVAEPTTAIERLFQSAAGSAADVATGVGAGQALMKSAAPVAQAAGVMLAEQPAAQLAGGVGSGLAAQAASELGLGAAGQAAAALIGGMAGSRAARTQVIPAAQASAAERALVTEAEKVGVPLMTSDVAPPRTFAGKAAQALGERVPVVGTGPVRQAQQEARSGAVKDLALELNVPDFAQASRPVMDDLRRVYGNDIKKYSKQKKDVINSLSSAGVMPVTEATKEIDSQISNLRALKSEEFAPVIKKLEDWRMALADQSITNVEKLRKQFGESFKAFDQGSVKSIGEQATNAIYGAINDDMGNFIRQNSGASDVTKWKSANKAISAMKEDVKNSALKSLLSKKGEIKPEVIGSLLFSKNQSEIELLHKYLDDAGRENAGKMIVARAIEKATVNDVISPDRFLGEMDRLAPQIGVFFKGDDKRRVEGLTRVLGATRRAAEAGVMTNTGQQAVPAATALAAGQVSGSALGGAVALGGAGLMARLYESPMVRNLLLRIPSTKVGSPEEAAILKRISGAMTARTTTPEEQPTQ